MTENKIKTNLDETDFNNGGVGPCPKPWPKDSKYDQQLLKNGDSRNVIDKYRYWKVEAIKKDLNQKAFKVEVAIENFQYDFNIGTIVRNANAFNVQAVHIIGKKHWNRRGAMVTDRYLEIYHHNSVQEFLDKTKGWSIVAVDNIKGAKDLTDFIFPQKPILVFGAEGPGLSDELLKASQHKVKIAQYGSTRSLNVGVASGIVLYEAVKNLI